jgi:hypothetical protein
MPIQTSGVKFESRWSCAEKAPEGRRTPRRFAFQGACDMRASVLECASPLALWPEAFLANQTDIYPVFPAGRSKSFPNELINHRIS